MKSVNGSGRYKDWCETLDGPLLPGLRAGNGWGHDLGYPRTPVRPGVYASQEEGLPTTRAGRRSKGTLDPLKPSRPALRVSGVLRESWAVTRLLRVPGQTPAATTTLKPSSYTRSSGILGHTTREPPVVTRNVLGRCAGVRCLASRSRVHSSLDPPRT